VLQRLHQTERPFLVIGRGGMDLYPDPPGSRTEDATSFFPALGGSSANIAVALCKFGQQAKLVTCVSDDAIGRYVVNQLNHYGIDASAVRPVQQGTRSSLAVVESRVENHQSVIYRNHAADFQMDRSDVEGLDYRQYAALVVTGTCLTQDPSQTATLSALRQAKAAGIPTVMDLDYRPYSWQSPDHARQVYHLALEMLDVIVGNDDEFGQMAGGYDQGPDYAAQLATQGKIAIFKRGSEGSTTYLPNGQQIDTGVAQVTPLKPTGAGDSFLGGLLAGMCRHGDLPQALKQGSACAAMVVTRVACAPAMPDLTELEHFLSKHSIAQSTS